uniref:PBPe domain-containing protein n=1 Tax=Macrostomum lignano TaxID=282301 RepID=A0A1I8IHX0_9PLAT
MSSKGDGGGSGSGGGSRCQPKDWVELSKPLLFSAGFCDTRQLQENRFSAVAIEMLREQEDRDLHPYGRGGRFEGVLYSRRVKVQVDHAKFLAWIVFAGFILLTSGAIIILAEMERRQKTLQHQQLLASVTQTPALCQYKPSTGRLPYSRRQDDGRGRPGTGARPGCPRMAAAASANCPACPELSPSEQNRQAKAVPVGRESAASRRNSGPARPTPERRRSGSSGSNSRPSGAGFGQPGEPAKPSDGQLGSRLDESHALASSSTRAKPHSAMRLQASSRKRRLRQASTGERSCSTTMRRCSLSHSSAAVQGGPPNGPGPHTGPIGDFLVRFDRRQGELRYGSASLGDYRRSYYRRQVADARLSCDGIDRGCGLRHPDDADRCCRACPRLADYLDCRDLADEIHRRRHVHSRGLDRDRCLAASPTAYQQPRPTVGCVGLEKSTGAAASFGSCLIDRLARPLLRFRLADASSSESESESEDDDEDELLLEEEDSEESDSSALGFGAVSYHWRSGRSAKRWESLSKPMCSARSWNRIFRNILLEDVVPCSLGAAVQNHAGQFGILARPQLDAPELVLKDKVALMHSEPHLKQSLNHVLDSLIQRGLVQDAPQLIEDHAQSSWCSLQQSGADLLKEADCNLNGAVRRPVEQQGENFQSQNLVSNSLVDEATRWYCSLDLSDIEACIARSLAGGM